MGRRTFGDPCSIAIILWPAGLFFLAFGSRCLFGSRFFGPSRGASFFKYFGAGELRSFDFCFFSRRFAFGDLFGLSRGASFFKYFGTGEFGSFGFCLLGGSVAAGGLFGLACGTCFCEDLGAGEFGPFGFCRRFCFFSRPRRPPVDLARESGPGPSPPNR